MGRFGLDSRLFLFANSFSLPKSPPENSIALKLEGQTGVRIAEFDRGKDWDAMDDEARIDFADELMHEDRSNY